MKKHKVYTYLITIPAGFIVGLPIWILWKWGVYDPIPFYIGWLIVHPVYKIWHKLGEI